MQSEIVAYVAVSLDGYIAGDGGTVDFLERFGTDEYDFHGFFSTIGAVAMGSVTYEQVLGWGWPYGETPGLVLTSRELASVEGAEITFSAEPTGRALRSYSETVEGRLWVVGGGEVILEGLKDGAIDVLELYVMPIALGSGVALFPGPYDGPLELVDNATFSNGAVKLVYRTGS